MIDNLLEVCHISGLERHVLHDLDEIHPALIYHCLCHGLVAVLNSCENILGCRFSFIKDVYNRLNNAFCIHCLGKL